MNTLPPAIRRQTIGDLLRRTAQRLPAKLAIACGDTRWTYAEFDALVSRLAAGLAQRGVLLRHLIMPGCVEDSKAIMRFVAKELSTHTYVNLMDQYYPAGKVDVTRYAALNRCITRNEYEEVLAYAQRVGLRRFDTRHAGYHWTQ